MPRLWYQSMAPIGQLPRYRASLLDTVRRASAGSLDVHLNGVRETRYQGRLPAEVHRYPYAKLMLQLDAIDFGLQAQEQGFDAYVIGSFSEPFLSETRSVLDIPVVSLAESTLLAACALGERFALISLSPEYARRLRGVVRRHGLESRLSNCHALPKSLDEAAVERAFSEPDALIEDFVTTARRAIAEGADTLIPAEGLLSELLAQRGLRRVDEAPVLDSVALTVLDAERQIHARTRLGVSISRRGIHARPPDDLLAQMRALRQ